MTNVELYKASPGPHKGRAQTWRFRYRATNGRILVTGSESYTNRQDAIHAIQLVFGAGVEIRDMDAEAVAL